MVLHGQQHSLMRNYVAWGEARLAASGKSVSKWSPQTVRALSGDANVISEIALFPETQFETVFVFRPNSEGH